MNYVVPVLLIATFVLAFIKKVPLYDTFTEGLKEAVNLTIGLIPYIGTVFLAVELMRRSGLSSWLSDLLEPLFSLLGIPKELGELLILRPLSGSGSLALLNNIYSEYGVDSYIARTASVIMGSTDTVMYISAVYFSKLKDKRNGAAVIISLIASLIGAIIAALLCKVM